MITACLLAYAVAATANASEEVLPVSWMKDGNRLELFTIPGYSVPLDTILRVVTESDERGKQIKSLADLEGLVTIDSPSDALEFVRLRTASKTTEYLYAKNPKRRTMAEVHPTSWEIYGRKWTDEQIATYEEYGLWGMEGVISEEMASKASLSKPKVEKTKDGFLVSRTVVFKKENGLFPYKITESVSRSGAYVVVSSEQIRTGLLTRIKWRIVTVRY